MIFSILQTILFSVLFIFLIHHLIAFFKNTLTVPKVKDLVNAPSKQYEGIYNIIDKPGPGHGPATVHVDDTPAAEGTERNMKEELKHFLKKQLTEQTIEPSHDPNANISSYDLFNGNSNLSSFAPF
jgi:hypothetical protein